MVGQNIYILDLAAKIDQCAEYICKQKWGDVEFPPPFGREALPEVSSAKYVYQYKLDRRSIH